MEPMTPIKNFFILKSEASASIKTIRIQRQNRHFKQSKNHDQDMSGGKKTNAHHFCS